MSQVGRVREQAAGRVREQSAYFRGRYACAYRAPAMDRESQVWVDGLRSPGAGGRDFAARLHGQLLNVARHEAGRRNESALLAGCGIDHVAQPAAAAAAKAIAAALDGFRGGSRFTTWASKFVMRELSASIGYFLRDVRAFRPDRGEWDRSADPFGLARHGEWGSLLAGLRRAVDESLSSQQRAAFTAIALNAVPADVLAVGLGTNRNAIYKALFEARRKLRATLAADGYIPRTSSGTMMTGPRWLEDLLAADLGDAGCELTFDQLDRYAEAQLSRHDPQVRFRAVAAHLQSCQACHEDLTGLLVAFAAQLAA
jgi:RNA polymerase sigma-70 factor, ECF subfamily